MPAYKGTLLFNYTGSQPAGFSESIEFTATGDFSAGASLATWPAQRSTWLAQQWSIVGFRLASVINDSVSGKCVQKFAPIQIAACPTPVVGQLGDADSPYAAVLFDIRFNDLAKRIRPFLARGIPDTWWSTGAVNIPAPDLAFFTAWFNFMVTQGAGAFKYNRLHNPPCPSSLTQWFSFCQRRIASRRIGRPFGLLRGRRSVPAAAP